MNLEINRREDERNHNLLCVLQKTNIGKCRRKGHSDRGSILVCYRDREETLGMERKGTWEFKYVECGRKSKSLSALKKVISFVITCCCSSEIQLYFSIQKNNYNSAILPFCGFSNLLRKENTNKTFFHYIISNLFKQ